MNSLRAYYFFVFAMLAVIVPHYQLFLTASGYSPREVGLLIGFFEICGVAGPMFFGRIADKTGRFRELKIGSTLGAGDLLCAVVGRLGAHTGDTDLRGGGIPLENQRTSDRCSRGNGPCLAAGAVRLRSRFRQYRICRDRSRPSAVSRCRYYQRRVDGNRVSHRDRAFFRNGPSCSATTAGGAGRSGREARRGETAPGTNTKQRFPRLYGW